MTNNEPVREMSGGAHALDRLLAPVDGSEASELALDYAVRLHPEEIVLLRVESGGDPGSPAGSGADQPDWYQVHAEQVRRGLERQAEQFGTDRTRVSYKIRYGDAAEEIIDEARHHNLVVMTTRGAGAAGRAVFGSVADRVARHGASPVLLVRAEEPFNAPAEVNRIIVPLDGSDRAEQALPIATDLSNRLPAPVHLVRVVAFEDVVEALRSSPAEEGDNPDEDRYDRVRVETEASSAGYLRRVASRLEAGGITVSTEVLGGSPAFTLLWYLNAEDIVVMTSRGMGGIKRWLLGNVSEKLVRESKAPVLLVPLRHDSGEIAPD